MLTNAAAVLAQVYGAMFILVGFSALNHRTMTGLARGMANNTGLAWVTGFFTFTIGAVGVALYDVWVCNWGLIVTITSWLILIKGAVLTICPADSMKFYKKHMTRAVLGTAGILAIIIGLELLYIGITASILIGPR